MISILSKAATWSPEQPFGEAFSRVFSSRLCSAQLIWTAVSRNAGTSGALHEGRHGKLRACVTSGRGFASARNRGAEDAARGTDLRSSGRPLLEHFEMLFVGASGGDEVAVIEPQLSRDPPNLVVFD